MKKYFRFVSMCFIILLLCIFINSCTLLCEHEWGEWQTVERSTCDRQGKRERSCLLCGRTQKDKLPFHDLVENVARPATCTRKGWDEYISCTLCDYTTYEEIEPLDHSYKDNFCENCGRSALSVGIIRGEAVVFGIGCYEGKHIEIPSKYLGYTVTQVGLNAFPVLYGIDTIIFPETITDLGINCFENCPDLKYIIAPKTLEKEIQLSFNKYQGLSVKYYSADEPVFSPKEKESLPCYIEVEEINGNMTVVGMGDFRGENIVIPEYYEGKPVKAIADGAFENCDHIKSVVIPCSVKKIGGRAFAGCTSLREVIFDNLNNDKDKLKISHDVFEGCSDIHLEIPWNLCDDLTCFEEAVTIATIHAGTDGWTSIYTSLPRKKGDAIGTYNSVSCVKYFKNLKTLIIGDDVVGIWDFAFQDCNNFETLVISGNVMKMGLNPFERCQKLKKVILKKGVSTIGQYAFKDCYSVRECIIEGPLDWTPTNYNLSKPKSAAEWLVSNEFKNRPQKYR